MEPTDKSTDDNSPHHAYPHNKYHEKHRYHEKPTHNNNSYKTKDKSYSAKK